MIGTLLQNRYRLDAEIGTGGMGTVYRAHDTLLERDVAVKVLNAAGLGTDGRARLLREAQAAAKLNHPNIVAVHDAGEVDGTPFIVMELVEGPSLRECLPSTIEDTLQIAQQLCATLEHAHAHGIVHRDLKPENVMVVTSSPQPSSPESNTDSGEGGAAAPLARFGRGVGGEVNIKLMDFGLARTFDSHLTTEGMIVGTVSYLAPEQALGQAIDGRTDLYALGVMLYELTTGRLPFTADDPLALISQHLYTPVVSPRTFNESILPELDALIVQLMSKQPDQRPASAHEVLRLLEKISAGERVPFAFAEGPRHNLTAQPSRFIGRERELAEIDQLLVNPACRLLTLVGAGGMGKTRLALEVAQRSLEKFPAGVWLTELAPIDRDESVAPAVAGAIGVQAQPPRSITDTIIDALQTRVLLLVIDNCEHVLDGATQLVTKILEHCPDTKILTTSREPLHVAGEQLYNVPGMILPDKDSPAEQLSTVDAVRLFVERAAAVRAGFALAANNTADVIAICRALDGMPLAIELAAARIRALSPHEIAQRIGQQLRLLSGSQRADVPHHQTLQATIAWSYDLLTEAECTVFNRLSVFHGGCTLEAAERVCAGDGIEPNDVLDLLTSLVDKSMVVADTSAEGATRYRVLETLRQYGRERLIESGQENAVCQRHVEFYTHLAELLEPRLIGSDEVVWFDCLQAEEDNFLSAMSWSVSHSDGMYTMHLGGALLLFIGGRSYRRKEYLDRLKVALHKVGTISPAIMAKALSTIGLIHWHLGEYAETAAAYLKGLDYAQQTGDRLCLARALSDAGVGELCQGHHDRARLYLVEAVEMARELGDLWTAEAMTFLADIEPHTEAKALLEEFLSQSRQQKSSGQIGYACFRLANFLLDDGDLAGAELLFEESLRQFSDPSGQSANARNLASIAILRGNYDKAQTLLQVSDDFCRKSFWPLDLASTLLLMGTLAWHFTNYDEAGSRYQESYAIYHRQSHQEGVAHVLKQQALLARDMNDLEQAWELSRECIQIYELLKQREAACSMLAIQGNIAYRSGSLARALELLQQSLKGIGESKDRIMKVTILEWIGITFASHENCGLAASLLAFAESQRNQMGIIIPPPEQPYHDEAIKILREALDEDTLAQAWQAGEALSLEEAMAEALGPS